MVHRPYQSVKTLYWRTFHRFMATFVRDFPTFVSRSSWSSTAPAAAQEMVEQRWNPSLRASHHKGTAPDDAVSGSVTNRVAGIRLGVFLKPFAGLR
jgi:hypothetical protein